MAWNKHSDYLVIIPAYNEEDTIAELVTRASKYCDVCVVNDCSKDSTLKILERFEDIKIINHEVNTHIPGAILDGMRFAVESDYKYAITMDAGLSHNPDEIPRFIDHDFADLVLGERTNKTNTPLFRRLLSLVGNFIYNACLDFPRSLFKRKYYKDISSGFRRYSCEAMKVLISKPMRSRSFDFLFESMMIIYRNKLTIANAYITYDFSNSSLNSRVVKDCLAMCMKTILKCN
ncbi:MAG: glycosyltransferase family 2 protein [Candidatus Theseobacter exili]|nr:glycosyltransferase family 2 protein [Candidatus Theseobacter exili]